jgi:hypothetical protein
MSSLSARAAGLGRFALPMAVGLALLWPALRNGFPLLFSDSGEYFARSVVLQVPEYRTFGYSAWLAIAWPGASVWGGVVAQSLLLGALLWWLVSVVAPGLSARSRAMAVIVGAIATAAPWVSSQVMPDVFAPITIIGVFLIVRHWEQLPTAGRMGSCVAVAFGVTTHATHLWLALGLVVFHGILGAMNRSIPWRPLFRATSAIALGAACLLAVNFAQTRQVFLSRGGHVYLLAHLLDTGLGQRLLRAQCPQAGYALCPYQAELNTNAAEFIWSKQVNVSVLGGWANSNGEAERMWRGVVRHYPAAYARSLVTYTVRQFAALDSYDGLVTYADKGYVAGFISHFLPRQFDDFLAAAQQRGAFSDAPALPSLHAAVFWLAVLASGALVVGACRRRDWRIGDAAASFQATVWVVLVANAALCANVSGVFDRYQVRVAWMLPVAVALSVAARRRSGAIERGAPVQP